MSRSVNNTGLRDASASKKGEGRGGGELVATCPPGKSNADNTTTKLETHIPATKGHKYQLC